MNCDRFTEEHERRLDMLAIPLGFALVKVLRETEVQRFFSDYGYDYPAPPQESDEPEELIGTSGGLRGVMATIRKLSGTDAPVLCSSTRRVRSPGRIARWRTSSSWRTEARRSSTSWANCRFRPRCGCCGRFRIM